MKHTPGPWIKSETQTGGNRIIGQDGKSICASQARRPREEDDANARLIAAAPEMLEELKQALVVFEAVPDGAFSGYVSAIRLVIAKAEGEE